MRSLKVSVLRQYRAVSVDDVFTSVYSKGKGKGKVHPTTGHEGPEGE